MELFLLYLWLRLDGVIAAACLATIATSIVLLFLTMIIETSDSYDNVEKLNRYRKVRNKLATALLVLASFIVLVPSSRDTAILVAGSYALDLSKTPEAGKVMTILRAKANEILDKELSNLGNTK